MENERLQVVLHNPEKTYYAGQNVTGVVVLNLVKRVKIRAIKVQLTGKGKCKWLDILRKESLNDSSRNLLYTGKEIYAHHEQPVNHFEPGGAELDVGEYSFDFCVPLEANLPSSFKGTYGSIKYKLRILVQKPWTFDEKRVILLNVVKRMIVPSNLVVEPFSIMRQMTKTINLFGSKPITLMALLPKDHGVRNADVNLQVTVSNNSNLNIEKLRFSIVQLITYFSHRPMGLKKEESVVVFQKETGNVRKQSEQSFAYDLSVPACPPSDVDSRRVINIAYEIRVEAVLRGFFKNIVMTLPFTVYSNDRDDNSDAIAPPNYEPNGCGAGNPFETSANTTSSLSSMGSPTHSLHCSESSSVNSTTSESSSTTLSPGGNNLPCVLPSANNCSPSYHIIGGTAYHIIRGSATVPYASQPNSPHAVNANTTVQLPSYASGAAQTSSASSCYPSTSASFMQPPGLNDLPPAYEELFGKANTPTGSPK